MRQPLEGRLWSWFGSCLLGASCCATSLLSAQAQDLGTAPQIRPSRSSSFQLSDAIDRRAGFQRSDASPAGAAPESPRPQANKFQTPSSEPTKKPANPKKSDKARNAPKVKDKPAASQDGGVAKTVQSLFFRPFDDPGAELIDEVIPLEEIRLVQVQSEQPFDSPRLNFGGLTGGGESNLASAELYQSIGGADTDDALRAAVNSIAEIAGAQAGATAGAKDAAAVIQASNTVQTLSTQQRSPVSLQPYVRGYKFDQVYGLGAGAFWLPVRDDLDSLLSKIDPSLIRYATVIPGPYGSRYGPGFAFIDVETINTPRYSNGYESHNRLGMTYSENGGQIYGRDTFFGGGSDYGYIFNYGNRTGSDYQAGNGLHIPASYHAQNFHGQLGFDLSPNSSVEFRYIRLDQGNTEYAAEFFDINSLVTDAFSLTLVNDNPNVMRESRTDMWFNRTRFGGDTFNSGKRLPDFPVLQRVDQALTSVFNSPVEIAGTTDGDLTSTGARTMLSYGDPDWSRLSFGADIRYIDQNLHENLQMVGAPPPADNEFHTIMPRAKMIDPGLFAEITLPTHYYWSSRIGARVDWVHTTASASDLAFNEARNAGRPTSLQGAPDNLHQNDILYGFYLANDFELSPNWDAQLSFGHAQRVPSLTQRYADGLFLGIIQSGFSRVIGDPDLDKERAWQADLRLEAEYDGFRGRATAFYSWIFDYATYSANVISDPAGARLLISTNTDLATLAGFELYGEADLSEMVTAFATLRYLEGRDREIVAPLPTIIPLESRAGLRIQDSFEDPVWGLEIGLRLVDNQDQLGQLRTVGFPGVLVPVETATGGFTTYYLRGFYDVSDRFSIVGGIDNLFDLNYLEHLDLRLPADAANGFPLPTQVLSPGFSAYVGIEWNL